MINLISQVPAPETSLLTENATQSRSDTTFAQYLEEEQKRLGALFAGWFGYADPGASLLQSAGETDQKIELKEIYRENEKSAEQAETKNSTIKTTMNNLARLDQTSFPKKLMQELLQKTGWLTPNLQTQPLFSQAQLSGKLLTSLDLQSLVDEIVSRVILIKAKGQVELSFGLKPENLGDMLITLASRADGISVNIQASAETKKLLDEQLFQLALFLKKAKINVTEIIVTEIKEGKNHA